MNLKLELKKLGTKKHQEFSKKLIPTLDITEFYGVKTTDLTKISRMIIKDNPNDFLQEFTPQKHEEIIVYGMVIAKVKISENERIKLIDQHLNRLNNWATCDSFCAQLKVVKKNPEIYWDYIQQYLNSKDEFKRRFALIMLKTHFVNDDYYQKTLNALKDIESEKYYEQMAIAWLLAELFTKYPDQTKKYLDQGQLNPVILNYFYRKVLDSSRVSSEDKDYIKIMRSKDN